MLIDTITIPLRNLNPSGVSDSHSHTLSAQTNVHTPAPVVGLVTDANISATHEKRHMQHDVWRTRVGTALLDYGMTKEAFQFNGCFEHPVHWIKSDTATLPADAATVWLCANEPNHKAALFMPTCDLRICPDCAARHSARLASRFIPKALELSKMPGRDKLKHVIFTTPLHLTQYDPDTTRTKIYWYMKLVRKSLEQLEQLGIEYGRSWKTKGAIVSFEFGEDGLHLHFHVVHYGDFLPQAELSKIWSKLTDGMAKVVYVRGMDYSNETALKKSIIETLKYSVKFWSTDEKTGETVYLEPTIMPHLLRVLKGMRRVKSWGVFYKLPKPKAEKFKCEECESAMLRLGLEMWSTWIESREAGIHLVRKMRSDALLHSKLANKSKKAKLYESHSPPDESEKYRQKDMWKPVSHSHYHYEDNL
jgi:hypothetical protein